MGERAQIRESQCHLQFLICAFLHSFVLSVLIVFINCRLNDNISWFKECPYVRIALCSSKHYSFLSVLYGCVVLT